MYTVWVKGYASVSVDSGDGCGQNNLGGVKEDQHGQHIEYYQNCLFTHASNLISLEKIISYTGEIHLAFRNIGNLDQKSNLSI